MKHILTFVALLCFTLTGSVNAQTEETFFLMHNQNIVHFSDGAAVDSIADNAFIPVLKSLVADSTIIGWGFEDHAWGDEWNKNWWIVAATHEDFLVGWGEFLSRVNDQFPDALSEMDALVQRHRDDLYIIRDSNFSGPAGALMVQQSIVPRSKLADWNTFMKEKSGPVLEGLLSEGLISSYGNLNHRWGSEWNAAFYLSAADVNGVLAAWGTFVARMNEKHPGWFGEAVKMIEQHKDNIYTIRVQG